jgi:hypothetical protein
MPRLAELPGAIPEPLPLFRRLRKRLLVFLMKIVES